MFGLEWWGDDNFIVEDGVVKVNYLSQPSLLEIVEKVRDDGMRGPMILRFPHLIKKQIESLFSAFHEARDSFNYSGNFHALFPLKVNQYSTFIEELQVAGKPFNYGLEAGSKAELLLAMAYNHDDAPITVNGFKDKEMIDLGFIAKAMGHNITLIMEGLNEIELLVELAKEKPKFVPNIGIRLRLHNSSPGIWSKSGGINAKFGLTSTELILALDLLKKSGLTHLFKMLHFHIGSQMSEINALKKAIKESGNIYADLINLGATNLNAVNIGGGLLIEYAQHEHERQKRYSLEEFANDVVYQFQVIALKKGVMVPDIYTESGRFIAAPHALMITPVIELFSEEYSLKALRLKVENPPLIEELKSLHDTINEDNAIEYMHDALEHLESLLTLFDLGYIDLVDRSNSEVLSASIVKKALMLDNEEYPRFQQFQERVQERYLVNFSLFQSLPDYWGLGQKISDDAYSSFEKKACASSDIMGYYV
jgi:arginine decarboxylase